VDVSSWDQVLRQLGLHDPFLDQLIEGLEARGSVALGVTLCLRRVVLESYNLGLKLLVECFSSSCSRMMFSWVERHLFPLTIELQLLLLHLLSHLVEHLKELVFSLLRQLDIGGKFLR